MRSNSVLPGSEPPPRSPEPEPPPEPPSSLPPDSPGTSGRRRPGFVANGQLNQFLLSFPNVDLGEHTMPNYTLTSNGFYFEHEQLEFSNVVYHSETNTIDLSGNFTVEMKELSCGFYSYFFVENARFQALIH